MNESQKILKLAISIGETLLKSGGEIYRVQETVGRVLEAYGIMDYHVFVVSNGIFATIHEEQEDRGSMVRYVPLGTVHLGKIDRLNLLSREICSHTYSLEEAFLKLKECQQMPGVSNVKRVLASGMGCAAFCYIFGGGIWESLTTFFLGMLLQAFIIGARRGNTSKFIINIIGSGLVTAVSLWMVQLGMGIMYDKVVIGSIMILLPGVALTMAIRELFSGDYLSGSIHLIDALLNAVCIAIGVGAAIRGFQLFGGII